MFKTILAISLSISFYLQAAYRKLIVASDVWCPYICEGNNRGILVDIVNEIAIHNNLDIDFNIIPFPRAMLLSQQNKIDMVLALTAQHIDDYQLEKSSHEFGGWYNDFYALKTIDFDLSSKKGLEGFFNSGGMLGVIKGYDYGSKISALLENHPKNVHVSTGPSPLRRNIAMLKMNRLDVILDSRFNIEYELNTLTKNKIFRISTEGDFVPLYIGFRSDTDKELITLFDIGLEKLRKSGKLEKIIKRYGVTDWKFDE